METITKRAHRPALSETGEHVLAQYERRLRTEEDLTAATIRNYESDLRHFAAWCEFSWKQGREEEPPFTPQAVTTPTLTDYRTYLQQVLHLKPNSVMRTRELCTLTRAQVRLGKRSGTIRVQGKRNTYREIPLQQEVERMAWR